MKPSPVRAVAFDVNETMFSLDAMRDAFGGVGLDPALVPLWFARLLRDAFALTALGEHRPFAEIAAETLRDLDPERVDDAAVAAALTAMRRLDPHPDVAPALRMLAEAGVPAITLTNGSVETTSALLERSGLAGHIAHVVSVDAVRRLKPAPEPYRHAAEVLAVPPGHLALVAAHPWDCAGARRAGLRAGWVRRGGARWPGYFPRPDATAGTLPQLLDALLGGQTAGAG